MEWATQDERLGPDGETASYVAPPTTFEPPPSTAPPPPAPSPAPPVALPATQDTMAMAPAPAVAPASPSPATGSNEQCQACGAYVASDQRYCLRCGQRHGDPRLPFMDASSFMETSMQKRRPPTPASPASTVKKSRISPNASLIAGVGTLLLAMGTGVLIGRSGEHSGGTASTPAVQVVKVPGVGVGAATGAAAATDSTPGSGGGKKPKAVAQSQSSKASAANSIIKPTAKAGKLPPPTVGLGDKGSGRGYNNGKFDGSFFGQ